MPNNLYSLQQIIGHTTYAASAAANTLAGIHRTLDGSFNLATQSPLNGVLSSSAIYLGKTRENSILGRRLVGQKQYELKDHLGNVRALVSDVKEADASSTPINHAQVLIINNYYPFGMLQPGRHYSSDRYRFGFNSKEMDNDLSGGITGAIYDYGFRIYDARIAKFLSVDPMFRSYPMLTPYQYASNSPIALIDVDGLEGGIPSDVADFGYYIEQKVQDAVYTATTAIENAWTGLGALFSDVEPNTKIGAINIAEENKASLNIEEGIVKDKFVKQDRVTRIEQGKRTDDIKGIVLHRTAGSTANSAINWWKSSKNPNKFGTPFIISEDGEVIQTASLDQKTLHTRSGAVTKDGESITISNSNSIGIEIVGTWNEETETWEDLSQEQKNTLKNLMDRLKNEYDLTDDDIYYHHQIDSKKKKGEGKKAVEAIK